LDIGHGHLQAQNVGNEEDTDSSDNEDIDIEFKQWITNNGTDLISMKLPIGDFIENLCQKLEKITDHLFIANLQSNHLKHFEETLSQNEAIFIGDFTENCNFIVQDEVQGYY